MAEFYLLEPKYNYKNSNRKTELVEYDINTLIRDEAELIVDVDDDISDEEWDMLVDEKAKEIKTELMQKGRWCNGFGQLIFLYF